MKISSILIFLLFTITSCWSQVNVYDDFEAKELSKIWAADRMVSDAFTTQSTIVRSGLAAAKITLKTGDVFEQGIGRSKNSERDELREANKLVSVEGKIYVYQFSLFLPDSFPIVPTRLVIAQWKQKCPDGGSCSDDSPVIAIRYVSGRMTITLQTDSSAKTVYKTKDDIRNKWLDFKFKVRFSTTGNGLLDVWLNGQQLISFKGITAYSSNKGYTEKNYFYFKMGLYRDIMPQPMTIYIDDYIKKEVNE